MEIPIDKPSEQFDKHLNLEDNDRIILSARFGNGKTYFLKKFIENNPKYDAIHLFPINYTVATNEDIFELIKYDILFNLLGKDVEFEKINIPHINTLLSFAGNNAHELISPFIKLIPKLGNSLYSIYEKLYELHSKYLEVHEKVQVDDEHLAVDYLRGFTEIKGNIYEEDFFTMLIKDLVNQLKKNITGTEEVKKTVLIIDDLDRIDPDHIFRILNVFAAHFDVNGKGNKFDFDRIILVFDISNVRKIFSNRFGAEVDFSGYIDKFYSKEIFFFDNKEAVSEYIVNVVATIKQVSDYSIFNYEKIDHRLVRNITYILSGFAYFNIINTRTIAKLESLTYYPPLYEISLDYKLYDKYNAKYGGIVIVDLLIYLLGDIDSVIEACEKCNIFEFKLFSSSVITSFIGYLMPIMDADQHQFGNSQETYTYALPGENIFIKYNGKFFQGDFDHYICSINSIESPENNMLSPDQINYFAIFKEFVKIVKEKGIIPLSAKI